MILLPLELLFLLEFLLQLELLLQLEFLLLLEFLLKRFGKVRPDEPGTASDQGAHGGIVSRGETERDDITIPYDVSLSFEAHEAVLPTRSE